MTDNISLFTKCTKCKTNLFDGGVKHAYLNKQTLKFFCKGCATSKKHNKRTPNPETFERIKRPKRKKPIPHICGHHVRNRCK